jgi:arylsulfatase A
VCFHEPHEPIASAPEHSERYAKFEDPAQRAWLGNITQMDATFGRLMAELDAQNLRDDTLVFFTSDNGPALTGYHPYGSTGELRAKKGHLYEGGIRVPGIFRWPGKIEAGSVSAEPVCGVDILPTLCEIAGIGVPVDRAIDGTSLVPLAKGETLQRKTPLYWHFLRASSEVKVAMREGPWKLCATVSGFDFTGPPDINAAENEANKAAELAEFELYHLIEDPAETTDRKDAQAAVFTAMRATMDKLYAEVRAESPTWPEWQWPRYEGQRIEWPEYSKKGRAEARK